MTCLHLHLSHGVFFTVALEMTDIHLKWVAFGSSVFQARNSSSSPSMMKPFAAVNPFLYLYKLMPILCTYQSSSRDAALLDQARLDFFVSGTIACNLLV